MYCRTSSSSNFLSREKIMKSYLGRKSTIFNKARELSTLCNVDILLIFYGPDKPNIPQVWCSNPDFRPILDRYYGICKKVDYRVQGGRKKEAFKLGGDDGSFIGELGLEELKNLNDVLAGKIDHVKQRINLLKVGPNCSNFINDDNCDWLGLDVLCDLGKLGFNSEKKTNNMIKVDQGYNCNSANSHDWMGEVVDWINRGNLGNNLGNCENLTCCGKSYRLGDLGFEGFTEVKVNNQLRMGLSFNSNNCVTVDYSNQMPPSSFGVLGCVGNNPMYSSLQHVYDSKKKKNCNNNNLTLEEKVDGFEFSDQMRSSKSNNCGGTELMVDISDLDDIKFGADDLEFIRQLARAEDPAFVADIGMFC